MKESFDSFLLFMLQLVLSDSKEIVWGYSVTQHANFHKVELLYYMFSGYIHGSIEMSSWYDR